MLPHDVSIEQLDSVTTRPKSLVQGPADGRLARGTQAGEPDRQPVPFRLLRDHPTRSIQYVDHSGGHGLIPKRLDHDERSGRPIFGIRIRDERLMTLEVHLSKFVHRKRFRGPPFERSWINHGADAREARAHVTRAV